MLGEALKGSAKGSPRRVESEQPASMIVATLTMASRTTIPDPEIFSA